MNPRDKRSNAVPALTIPKPQDQPQQSSKAGKETTAAVQSHNQDGPERFASWYPLLQKVRHENPNHGPAIAQTCPDIIHENNDPDWIPNDCDKIWVNKLVPYHEYPAVQLQNGILTPRLSKPPRNLKWLEKRLRQPRDDSDWTPAEWQKYKAYPQFRRDRNLTRAGMRHLFKRFSERSGYRRAYFKRWYDFPEYAPFAQGLEQPCPGFTQGFPLEAYDYTDIECLSAAVCYRSEGRSITLPHMAGEFAVKSLEAEEAADARHGAALVYMRNTTLLHARMKQDPEDVAMIVTFISNGLFIRFYAHYKSKTLDGKTVYHQYPILEANLAKSYDEFLRGVAMLRNCQDLAFVLAMETSKQLEHHHAVNGINAWAYHLDDAEHILSESEDSVIEPVAGQKDSYKGTTHRNEDQSKSGASDPQKKRKKLDKVQPPTTRVLRPRKRPAQEEKKPTPKQKQPSRKRLRTKS